MRQIALLGADPDFRTLIHIVAACGLRPMMICPGVRALPFSGGGYELDADLVHDYARQLRTSPFVDDRRVPICSNEDLLRTPSLPVLIASYGARERNYFREEILYARNKLGLRNPLVHPAALCDLVRLQDPRYLITGFPGSGNMIVQGVVAKILEKSPRPAADPIGAFFSSYAISHHFSIADKMSSAFDEVGRIWDTQAPSHVAFGGSYVFTADSEAPTFIAGLPMRAYAWANPWTSSHEPLTRTAIDFYRDQGLKIIYIQRHPLDVLVSNAGKITSFAGQRCAPYLLNNRDWVERMVDQLELYAEESNPRTNQCITIRYEELMETPINVIRHLAAELNVDLSPKECFDIWSGLEDKELSYDKGHRWSPGYGKWRDYIPPECASIVCSEDRRSVWKRIGYDAAPSDLTGAKSSIPPEANRLDLEQVIWQDHRWEAACGKRSGFSSDNIVAIRENGILGVTHVRHREIIEKLLGSLVFRDMLSAAYLGLAYRPCARLLSSYCDDLRSRAHRMASPLTRAI